MLVRERVKIFEETNQTRNYLKKLFQYFRDSVGIIIFQILFNDLKYILKRILVRCIERPGWFITFWMESLLTFMSYYHKRWYLLFLIRKKYRHPKTFSLQDAWKVWHFQDIWLTKTKAMHEKYFSYNYSDETSKRIKWINLW